MSPARRRSAVLMLQERLDMLARRACRIVGQHRSTQRRPVRRTKATTRSEPASTPSAASTSAGAIARRGGVLRDEGWAANRKKIQRLWREERLKVPSHKRKRQRLGILTCPADRLRAKRPNHVWGLDFQFDQTADGRILIGDWKRDYNNYRLHSSLGWRSPVAYAMAWEAEIQGGPTLTPTLTRGGPIDGVRSNGREKHNASSPPGDADPFPG